MSLRAVTIEEFPGLDLRADPGDSHGAIDLLNVTIESGRVRVRDGTVSHLNFTPAGKPVFLMPFPTAIPSLMALIVGTVGAPGTVYAVDQNGASVGSITIGTATIVGMSGIALGTATATYAFIANDGAVRRWDGTTWINPAVGTFPATPGVVSLSPGDNRLVVVENNTSKVWFSDQGDPTTFGTNNFVQLDPGDGEIVVGSAIFNNQTYIFKSTKFFVFYGNSDNPAAPGTPLFNYRAVRTGVKIPGPKAPQSICVAPDGVYFLASDGIYRTTGGTPVKISQALDYFFRADATHVSPYWQGGTWTPTTGGNRLCWAEDKLYVSVETSSTTSIIFVLDHSRNQWSAWSFTQSVALCATTQSTTSPNTTQELFIGDGTNTRVLRTRAAATDDAGSAIVSRYRLPFETYGDPGEKRIRETILEGIGTPTAQWSHDWGTLATGSAVTLGTSPAIAVGRQRLAMRGRAFSLQLGKSSGFWSINRAQANIVPDARPPSVTV